MLHCTVLTGGSGDRIVLKVANRLLIAESHKPVGDI